MTAAAEWVRSNSGGRLDADVDHARCLDVLRHLAYNGQIYNVPTPGAVTDAIHFGHKFVSILTTGTFSTFDSSELTALVVEAHRQHVRIQIGAWVPLHDERRAKRIWRDQRRSARECGYEAHWRWDDPQVCAGIMEVYAHARQPTGSLFERHPGVDGLRRACGEDR